MSIKDAQREAVAERLAGHLLKHGLALTSLRQLAAAAGVSDRMLLYYFGDKAEVLLHSLTGITDGFVSALDAAIPATRIATEALLSQTLELIRSPAVQPSMRLWLEIMAAAARNEEPFPRLAAGILDRFLDWLDQRLEIADATERNAAAAHILATIDGIALFDLVGRHGLASAAQRRICSTN